MERRAAGKKTNYEAQLRGRQPHPSVLRRLLKYAALCEKFRFSWLIRAECM